MENKFKIVGMSAPMSFTCNTINGDIFWAKSGLLEDKYKELFKWAKSDDDFWKQSMVGLIEYGDIGVGNTPIQGVVKSIEIDSDNWISPEIYLPQTESYYEVKFEDGEIDEKPFRIRPSKGIRGFMTERKISAWRLIAKGTEAG